MYRDNDKNSSNSSSGCEEDFSFETDDNYVNDVDDPNGPVMFASAKHNYTNHIKDIFTNVDEMKNSTVTASLNLSPIPHFPPPPDYPPPSALSASRTQTQPRSRYYYYENGANDVNCTRRRVGSLDRDCAYAIDDMYGTGQPQQNGPNSINGSSNFVMNARSASNGTTNSHSSANNSFSSSSSCSNSSVVMYKSNNNNKKGAVPPHAVAQMRFSPATTKPIAPESDSIEIYEQDKRYPFKSHSSSASSTASATNKSTKNSKNKLHHDTLRSINGGGHSISAAEIYEQNSIQVGGSAASIAREAKLFATNGAEPQVSFLQFSCAAFFLLLLVVVSPSCLWLLRNGDSILHFYFIFSAR